MILRLVAVLVVLAPAPAWADARAVAEKHLHRGNELSQAGDHHGAIAEYERAYELVASPNLLFNLAREHKLLAASGSATDAALAIDYYRRYLGERPDAPDRATVEAYVAALEAQLHPAPVAPSPPVVVVKPEPPPPPPPPAVRIVVAAPVPPPPAPPAVPVYRRWWFVAGVAAAAVVGAGVGVAVAATTPRTVTAPQADLPSGALHF